MPELSVTLVKSPIGNRPATRATVRAIGLRRLSQTIIVHDSESIRGMLSRVSHLVHVQEVSGKPKTPIRSPGIAVVKATADGQPPGKPKRARKAPAKAAGKSLPKSAPARPSAAKPKAEKPKAAPAAKARAVAPAAAGKSRTGGTRAGEATQGAKPARAKAAPARKRAVSTEKARDAESK